MEDKNVTPVVTPEAEKPKTQKQHPLGKMVKVKAYALSPTEKKSQIFCSINQFNFEFQQNTEVLIPEGVVKFLQSSTRVVHTVNEGNPVTEYEPLYAVTIL